MKDVIRDSYELTKHHAFRGLSWIKYVLIAWTVFLICSISLSTNEILEKMSEAETTTTQVMKVQFQQTKDHAKNAVDQAEMTAKRQRDVLDQYDNCAKQQKVLDSMTGNCK